MKKRGILYMITGPTGKSYIGITCQGIWTRLKGHQRAANNGVQTAFAGAVRKYGLEKFKARILAITEPSELSVLEQKAIKAFGTLEPLGYNLTHGGDGGIPGPTTIERMRRAAKRRWADPEQRALAAEKQRGKRHSAKTRAKMSARQHTHTAETKEKVRAAVKA